MFRTHNKKESAKTNCQIPLPDVANPISKINTAEEADSPTDPAAPANALPHPHAAIPTGARARLRRRAVATSAAIPTALDPGAAARRLAGKTTGGRYARRLRHATVMHAM